MSQFLRLNLAAVGVALLAASSVVAQIKSDAVCEAQYGWMNNTLNQNPCLVAAYMQGVCTSGTWTTGALPDGRHYVGPTADEANLCQCSTVVYDLLAACSVCQGRIYENWSVFAFNCTSSLKTIGAFPLSIPAQTAVPQWAFQDPTSVAANDRFDAVAAQATGDLPESTFTPGASSTAPPSGAQPSGTSGGDTTTGGYPSATASSKSKTPIGAIVGGVVGGLFVVGLIAALVIFFVVKNKRRNTAPSAQYTGNAPPMTPVTPWTGQHSPSPLLAQHSGYTTGTFATQQNGFAAPNGQYGQPGFGGSAPMPLYNPDDPTTFPQGVTANTTGQTVQTSYGGSRGGYAGVPEL